MTNREKYILSIYEELSDMGKHENVKLVKNTVNDGIYIKKTLKNYNIEIYKILKNQANQRNSKSIWNYRRWERTYYYRRIYTWTDFGQKI